MDLKFLGMIFVVFSISLLSCQSAIKRSPSAQQQEASEDRPTNGLQLKYFKDVCGRGETGYTNEVSPAQLKVIQKTMGIREHRIWHYFWHATRNSWTELTPEQQEFFLKFDARWKPLRLLEAPTGQDATAGGKYDPKSNGAGEDFLFMHHQMMLELFTDLNQQGLECIAPWNELPKVTDAAWPIEGKEPPKDEKSYQQMQAWTKKFHDLKYLKGRKLSEVGYVLENSLHNNMHMRWASDNPPRGFGERPEVSMESLKRGLKKYDDPKYDWLADPYSAHVNPVFWKLHGLVESVIFYWLEANGYESVAINCGKQKKCYQWKGTWMGASPHSVDESMRTKPPTNLAGAKAMPGHPHEEDNTQESGEATYGIPVPKLRHDHGEDTEDSFADSFTEAVNRFVVEPSGSRDIPKGSVGRGGFVPSPAEKARRLKVVESAMKILDKNSPMSRGKLSEEVLRKLEDQKELEAMEDPARFVERLDQVKAGRKRK